MAHAGVQFPPAQLHAVGMQAKVKIDETRSTSFLFARLNDEGEVIRILQRRSVHRDTVKLRFERGGLYLVRVGRARRTLEVCGVGKATAEVRVLTPEVPVGGTVAFQLVNTSRSHVCLMGASFGGSVEHREADGTWSATTVESTLLAGTIVTPWRPHDRKLVLPATAGPGVYRVRDRLTREFPGGSKSIR